MPSRLDIGQNVISGHSTGHNTVPVSVNVVQPQVPDAATSTPNSLDPVSQVLPDTLQPNYTPLLPVNTILQPDPNIQDGVLPGFVWGGIDGDIFRARISESYEKVIHWKPNLFLLPYCAIIVPLGGELFNLRSANTNPQARLDIKARGFWNRGQDAFFDVRVFNPNAPSYRNQDISNLFSKHEREKKREYNQRVLEVEHSVFTPLVFSTSGGMSKECTVFYKRLADLLSKKKDEPYSVTMGWLRCRLNFALLRSSILCVRGSRSSKQHPIL